jgi:hypothetical protein
MAMTPATKASLSTRDLLSERQIIYILHIVSPDGSIDHYTGLTTARGLKDRLKSHRCGRGAKRTGEAKAKGAKITRITIVQPGSRLRERVLTPDHLARQLCLECRNAAGDRALKRYTREEP